jgi:hypothetical protein
MKYILCGIAALIMITVAYAGNVNVIQGDGTSTTYQTTTVTSGVNVSNTVVCDQAAGAFCATVTASNLLSTLAFQGGTWLVTANPSGTYTVSVINTVSVSPTGTTPVQFSGTVSVSPTGNTPITGTVGQSGNWQVGLGTTSTSPIFESITNTVSVSPTGNTPVTGSVGVTGTVSTSPTGNTPVQGSVSVTGTVSTSPTGTTPIAGSITNTVSVSPTGTTPITGTITGTVSTSPTGNTPVTGTVAASQSGNWQVGLGTTATSQIFVAGNVGAALGTTQASPVFAQLTTSTSSIGNVGAALGTTSTSPIFVGGNVGAALGTTQTSPIFSQLTTSTSAIGSVTVFNTVTVSTVSATQPVSPVGTTPISPTGTVPISGTIAGVTATIGNAVPTSAVYGAQRAVNAEITAASNGNLVGLVGDLVGKLIVMPYANKENLFTFAISSTASAPTILVPAFGQGVYPYITALSCYYTASNAGPSSQVVTIAFSPTNATAGVATISPIYRMVLGNYMSGTAFHSANFPTPLGGVAMGTQNSNVNVYMRGTDNNSAFSGLLGCNASGYKGT